MSSTRFSTIKWPKARVELTPEERMLKDKVCLEFHDWGYTGLLGFIQKQGHIVTERLSRVRDVGQNHYLSLDLACGTGQHFPYVLKGLHIGVDRSFTNLQLAQSRYPNFVLVHGDAYRLPFKSGIFDRVISIYTLEHLHRLPECLGEIRRVLKPKGEFLVALPAEGGLLYEWGRYFTSKRYFERKYAVDYLKLVRSEHCNTGPEVVEELREWFTVEMVRYLPFGVPSVHLNAVLVARCVPDTGGEIP